MKGRSFARFLRILVFLNIFIFLYTPVLLLRSYAFNTTGLVTGAVLPLLWMFLGVAVTSLICRNEYYFTTRLASYACILIPIAAAAAIYSGEGIGRIIFEVFIAGMFYLTGSFNFSKSYQDIFTSRVLLTDIIFLGISLAAAGIVHDLQHLRNIVFILILINIPVTMLIKSEANIDEVFLFRGVEIPEVQRSIRKENIKLVLILYGIILILFNIKDLLSSILRFLFLIYIKVSFFILYLLSKIYGGQGGASQGTPALPDLPVGPEKAKSPLDYILTALIGAFIVYVIYKLFPKVVKGVARLIEAIIAKFTKKTVVNDRKYNDGECIEIIEITKQLTDSGVKRKRKPNLYSILRKTPEPAERIRLMYRIILSELTKKGIALNSSDTTGQVVEKAGSEIKEELNNLTSVYDKVRYGEEVVDTEGLGSVEESFGRITGRAKK